MRKLLNTVYITNEMAYLTLDGENLVCKIDGEIKLRIPFENIENIVCFNYIGCSPALVKYTLPENETQIFASKYKLYLPSEEELLRELNQEYQALEASKIEEESIGDMKEKSILHQCGAKLMK